MSTVNSVPSPSRHTQFTLTIVIPVWNDESGLRNLLKQLAGLDLFTEIIIVDDGSNEPVESGIGALESSLVGKVVWLRNDTQRGAGHARNIGLERVTSSHVIFFDSDDLLAEEFTTIVNLCVAEVEPFDFVLFRHDDSRILEKGGRGSFEDDELRWSSLDGASALRVLSSSQVLSLCQISAYPWNKIYRTAFLLQNTIRCTETVVHNDIELHWSSFIVARRILATTLIGTTHFCHDGGHRLSNRRGRERLEAFQALQNTFFRIVSTPDLHRLAFLNPFLAFCFKLLSWIRSNIDPAYYGDLATHKRSFFFSVLNQNTITLVACRDPRLVQRITATLTEEIAS